MRVTTKEVLQWNKDKKIYESVSLESHQYNGEVDRCEKYDKNWWFGPNSYWGKLTSDSKGSASVGDVDFNWGGGSAQETDVLKYGFIILGVIVILRAIK